MSQDTEYFRRLDTAFHLLNWAGEWTEHVGSPWIEGVSSPTCDDDPNMSVHLYRSANNQPQFGRPLLEHEICIRWSVRKPGEGNELSLSPEAAVRLGRYLMESGTAALRDRARHSEWMLGIPSKVVVEVPEHVLAPAESLPLVSAGTGRHETLATVRSGDVSLVPERFDYKPDDGTAPTAEWSLRALTPSLECLREFLDGDDLQGMRQQAADLTAALTRAMEIFDDEAEKLAKAEAK